MFDDKGTEDIFAGTDKGRVDTRVDSTKTSVSAPQATVSEREAEPVAMPVPPRSGGGGLRTIIIVLLALIAIATAAYLTYAFMVKPPSNGQSGNTVDEVVEEEEMVEDDEEEADETVIEEPEEERTTILDSDGDGLINSAELEAGTSVTKPDTDSDGLGDREEVQVYGTDPRRTDTDDDGYLDGEEVKGGYNPNGPGKLLEIPSEESDL